METKFEHLLISSHKADMIRHMKSHPEDFQEALQLALADKQPYSWRAAWVLWSCMDKNDRRLQQYIPKFIDILPERKESQQREFLMILQRMELNDDAEGKLFDVCTKLWTKLNHSASLRYNAFKMLAAISKKHPDFNNELESLMEPRYMESLSHGVKKSLYKCFQIQLPK
ncbi:MAG: hypothetical protein KG003_03910 [Bacteroidetes bacterium]|nr:hypothetical protein [Bacteroidota bacterium]